MWSFGSKRGEVRSWENRPLAKERVSSHQRIVVGHERTPLRARDAVSRAAPKCERGLSVPGAIRTFRVGQTKLVVEYIGSWPQ